MKSYSYLYSDNAIVAIGLFTIAVLILRFVYQKIYDAFFGPLSKIPGPKLAILSALPYLITAYRGIKWRWIQFELVPKYGKMFRAAPKVVVTYDKDIVREIIVKEDWPKSDFYRLFSAAPYVRTLFSVYEKTQHKQNRRLFSPAFAIKHLCSLEPFIAKCICNSNKKINSTIGASPSSDGIVINFYKMIVEMTLDIVGYTAFGTNFNVVQEENHPLAKEIAVELNKRAKRKSFPIMTRFLKSNIYLYEFATKLISQRRQAKDSLHKDLFQIILDAQDTKDASPSIDMHEQIVEFIVAGSDTTAFSTFYTSLMLLKHPDKMQKLIEEFDREFVDLPKDELPKHDKLKTLPYLNAVVNEGLRLWPVTIDGIARTPSEDTVIKGTLFPKGCLVLSDIFALHRSTEYWGENADEFVPERWFDPNVPRDAYYPFSAGSRNCIGQNFALLEMRLIIASIFRRFRVEDISGQDHWDIVQYLIPSLAKSEYNVRVWNR